MVEEMGEEGMGKGSEADEPPTEDRMAELAAEEVRGARRHMDWMQQV